MAVPVNSTTRKIISALMRDGRVRRAYWAWPARDVPRSWRERLGRRPACSSPRWWPAARPTGPARPGDLLLTVAGHRSRAQDLQRLMFSEAIGKPLAITGDAQRRAGGRHRRTVRAGQRLRPATLRPATLRPANPEAGDGAAERRNRRTAAGLVSRTNSRWLFP